MAQLAAQQLAHLLQKQPSSAASEQCAGEAVTWALGCLQVSPLHVILDSSRAQAGLSLSFFPDSMPEWMQRWHNDEASC